MYDEDADLTAILAPESDYLTETPPAIAEMVGVDTSEVSEQLEDSYSGEQDDYRQMFDEIGGAPVVEAITELLNNEDADLTAILHPDQVQNLIWQTLDSPANVEVLLADPDVQQGICDYFFAGRNMDEVRNLIEYFGDDVEVDPEYLEQREYELAQTQAHEERIHFDLQERLFVDTEQDVAERFNLIDPDLADIRSDIRLAAQARYLAENADDYLSLQKMLAQGYGLQAQLLEARLTNKWQATLIKTAERLHKVQPQRAPGLPRPTKATTGDSYDLGSSDWLSKFTADFRAERQRRGL